MKSVSHISWSNSVAVAILLLSLLLAAAIGRDGGATEASAAGPPPPPAPAAWKGWQQYGGGPDQSKYVPLTQITKANVHGLEVAWTYPTTNGTMSMFNPIVVDGVMYVLAKNNSLVALDATTGKEIWIHANLTGIIKRGINYWESKDRTDRRLLFCMNNTLQAIDARTGLSILTFGENGATSLKEGLGRDPATISRVQSTTPGQIYDNLIFLGSSPGENLFSAPGHLRAYDVVTGKLVWVFHTIPQPGEYGYETWPKDAYKYVGGANTWGEITVDEKRGIVFFPTGSPTYDYYGADREGQGLFGTSLLALDARTGKRLWHFQLVHHDLWDYDACAAPQLITVRHNGKVVDAVAQATKQGFLFVFDRLSGEPLWPVEERPVPAAEVPGEKSWPTQPFPTVVPPFNRQTVTAADVNPYFTPEQRERWTQRIAAAKTGIFHPLSDKYETIAMPGAVGGANYGNTAADPKNGIVYVAFQDFPSVYRLRGDSLMKAAALAGDRLTRVKETYVLYCQSCHGADRAGLASIPSLANLSARMTLEGFKTIVGVGRGQMPGFPHIDEVTIGDLYIHLGDPTGVRNARPGQRGGPDVRPASGAAQPATGPVVASGGAPGGRQATDTRGTGAGTNRGAAQGYPPGVTAPTTRYTTEYGLEFPNLLTPPWSSIAAYDLNEGKIKWKRPLGEDPKLVAQGIRDTGVPNGSQRKGMIVTSTGVLVSTCRDGKVYAYDADNGNQLWSTQLPRNTEGLPAMYEAGGRQFLVVGSMAEPIAAATQPTTLQPGYIVYALPLKK